MIVVEYPIDSDDTPPVREGRVNALEEVLACRQIKMMEEIGQQNQVVALPIFDVKGTSGDRSVSLTDTRCLGIGRSDLQHIWPIQRNNVGMGIVCGKHDSEDPVTGGDLKNLE